MAIQRGNLIKLHAALFKTSLTKTKNYTLLTDSLRSTCKKKRKKNLESTHIACQQQSQVAVPMVLLFGQFTMPTDVISYIINTSEGLSFGFLPEAKTEGL